jgi:lipid-binding SYLF domain-containing protein
MRNLTIVFAAAVGLLISACATTPKTVEGRQDLMRDAQATLETMRGQDPGLDSLLQQSAGYVVFPEVGKGGVIVGGAYGRGIVFENGQPVGYAELNQASIGAQLGGQTFSELIVFRDPQGLAALKEGRFDIGATASATALTAGAAATTQFGDDGVAVFVVPRGGLMVDVSVSGQQINFEPRG